MYIYLNLPGVHVARCLREKTTFRPLVGKRKKNSKNTLLTEQVSFQLWLETWSGKFAVSTLIVSWHLIEASAVYIKT